MDCPNCGTWNPEDKDVCWRCQQKLPRKPEKKKRNVRRIGGLPLWMWVALILLFLSMSVGNCLFLPPPIQGSSLDLGLIGAAVPTSETLFGLLLG